jgi:hypothetical protein
MDFFDRENEIGDLMALEGNCARRFRCGEHCAVGVSPEFDSPHRL